MLLVYGFFFPVLQEPLYILSLCILCSKKITNSITCVVLHWWQKGPAQRFQKLSQLSLLDRTWVTFSTRSYSSSITSEFCSEFEDEETESLVSKTSQSATSKGINMDDKKWWKWMGFVPKKWASTHRCQRGATRAKTKRYLLDMIGSDFLFFYPRHHLEQSSSRDVLWSKLCSWYNSNKKKYCNVCVQDRQEDTEGYTPVKRKKYRRRLPLVGFIGWHEFAICSVKLKLRQTRIRVQY